MNRAGNAHESPQILGGHIGEMAEGEVRRVVEDRPGRPRGVHLVDVDLTAEGKAAMKKLHLE
jgi:hypothetical protein